jgi:hypothetical protein
MWDHMKKKGYRLDDFRHAVDGRFDVDAFMFDFKKINKLHNNIACIAAKVLELEKLPPQRTPEGKKLYNLVTSHGLDPTYLTEVLLRVEAAFAGVSTLSKAQAAAKAALIAKLRLAADRHEELIAKRSERHKASRPAKRKATAVPASAASSAAGTSKSAKRPKRAAVLSGADAVFATDSDSDAPLLP